MTHYVTVQIDVTDPEAMAAYRERGYAPVLKHGGEMIAGGPECEVLEDTGAGAPASVLLAFPDAQAAKDWMADPEFADVYALRRKAARTVISLLPPRA
ncbi:DUF1330 domain-containing protein [Tropicimonas marinistellae]|uniref:DUF1330 domain-containing protein n=1 Tax=Tropicimonas marinistellae TaxID=1739787 RepID=UPI000831B3D8|nr:DUF1330 domain-containing protein [Tropicimonas marinistellae]